jgi:hypothetical protein
MGIPMQQHRVARVCWIAGIAIVFGAPVASADPAAEARSAETLVRQIYYEGLPYEDARAITEAGAARLAAMLVDTAEESHATNIVLALGIAARPGAYEALAGVAERGSSGEVDRGASRLRTALPIAMGHLARSDERAYAWLVARVDDASDDPGWSSGSLAGPRLAAQLRRRAIAGLALSGRPDADAILQRLAQTAGQRSAAAADPELAAIIETARGVHARIARDGADAALATRRAE